MAYSEEKDLFPFIGTDEDTDILIFFTDGESEPKKLNVRRCIEGNTSFSGNFLNYAGEDLKDFISACPKTPEKAIQFSWARETGKEGNFEDTNGMQFAYQNIYVDGFVSSISPISEVAYPPSIQGMGAKSKSEIRIENVCILQIPEQGPEVDGIKILFREGNEGAFKLIDEISNKTDILNDDFEYFGDEGILGYYSFRNDSVYPILPAAQVNKNFDNLPRKARAQTISANRLMYGNYLDGFDNVATAAEVETLFQPVTQPVSDSLADGDKPVTTINVLSDRSRLYDSDSRAENAGFIIDVGEENIPVGTYRLSINLAPEQNFHLYSAQTYLSSRNQVFNGVQGFSDDPIEDYNGGSSYRSVHKIKQPGASGTFPVSDSGQSFLYPFRPEAKGAAQITWGGTTSEIGATPAQPLILKGDSISFDIELEVTEEASAEEFMAAIDSVLILGETNSLKIGYLDYTGNNINIAEFGFNFFDAVPGVFNVLETNVGLDEGRYFPAANQLADLICQVPSELTDFFLQADEYSWPQTVPYGAPRGFFIINKASTILNVERVSEPEYTGSSTNIPASFTQDNTSPIQDQGSPLQTATRKYYRIVPTAMNVDDIMSCLPEPVPGLGSGKTYLEGSDSRLEYGPEIPWGAKADIYISGQDSFEGSDSGDFTYRFYWPVIKTVQGAVPTSTGYTTNLVPLNADTGGFLNFNFGIGDVDMDSMPTPQLVGSTYRFKRDGGSPYVEFDAVITNFNTSQNKITVNEATIEMVGGDTTWWEGVLNSNTILSRWSCSLVDTDGTDTTNVNYPADAGIRDRNGALQTFSGSRVLPIAIGRWYCFNSISGFDDYKLEVSRGNGLVTIRPQSSDTMLPPHSSTWDSFASGNTLTFGPHDDVNISLIDGAGGVGGGATEDFSSEIFVSLTAGDLTPRFGGPIALTPDTEPNGGAEKPVSNRRGTVWNTTLVGLVENMRWIHPDVQYGSTSAAEDKNNYNNPVSPTNAERNSSPFSDIGSFLDISVEGEALSSFKTRDYHDFGIVYYDQRGRAGYVNSLPSAYVPGYSDEERLPEQKGKVAVKYTLLHAPPEWADSYKIVYSGSANTARFIQYSAGGAFTEPSASGGLESNIYVSLNYLQGKKMSYTSAYGAVDQDTGENVLYRFTPGDKLRVISYYTDDNTIVYASKEAVFDVIGVEEISEESNSPIFDEAGGYDDATNLEKIRRSGSFVLLRNNPAAEGFNAFEVGSGTSFWGSRCIFEIITPRKERGDEQIPYYETPFGGKIVTQVGTRIHQYGTITIDQGDVFFRKVPVNIQSYDSANQEFVEIMTAGEDTEAGYPVDTSEARLKSYFLESNSATDLYRSNAKSYGKKHFKVDGARERLNDSSIIYSAPTNQESFNLFYTSFSPLEKNYFDLPNKYGDIDYISDFGSDLFVAQNSKVGFLQVERSLTSSAAGQDTVNISSDVIGSPRYFPEDVGTDGHPESVTITNASALFVDKSRGLIVNAGLRGMDILSSANMTTFFKNTLDSYPDSVRIVSGFNPRTEEFIVSMFDPSLSNSVITPSDSINQYELGVNGANTYAYDIKGKSWVTSYSFHSTEYSNVGDVFVSYKSLPIEGQTMEPVFGSTTMRPKTHSTVAHIHRSSRRFFLRIQMQQRTTDLYP